MSNHLRKFLRAATYRREVIDRFLDPSAPFWAQFHSVLGYTLRSSFLRDGLNGAHTLQRYAVSGERVTIQFAGEPCRINTYGNSFTQGAQVSDGETWQEVLAAHFCEPIRNFGIGGHGVYQAYRRLVEMEQTDLAAPCVILNIWGDDHLRSINAWRWLTYFRNWNTPAFDHLFHGNPWDHARLDPETGALLEVRNHFPNPDDLYKLADPDFVYESFHQDPIVRLLAGLEKPAEMDLDNLRALAHAVGVEDLDTSTVDAIHATAWKVYSVYGIAVSTRIIGKLNDFLTAHGKKLLVLLSYPDYMVREVCAGTPRSQTSLPDWHPPRFQEAIRARGIPVVDTLPVHLADFQTMRLSPGQYVNRYYVGHYNPLGNHFFAHAVRDTIKDWLDPKPPAYRNDGEAEVIRFQGYLPGTASS